MACALTNKPSFVQLATFSRTCTHLEAISIGSTAFKRIFNQGSFGKVHSVFGRAFNILTDEERLVAVVQEDLGRGPINIVTAVPRRVDMASLGVQVNDEVARVDDLIIVGENILTVSTKNAEKWKQRRFFQGKLLTTEEIMDNLTIVKDLLSSRNQVDGLSKLTEYVWMQRLEKGDEHTLNPCARMVVPCISKLRKAIKAGNSRDIKRSAKRMIGLGPGLTPSADDLLSGMMISMSLLAKNLREQAQLRASVVSRINRDIVESTEGRTTLISQEFLMNAMAGEANEPIITLIEKILTAERNEVENATENVLAIGATSGADVILGILLGSRLQLDVAENMCGVKNGC